MNSESIATGWAIKADYFIVAGRTPSLPISKRNALAMY